MKEIKEVLVVEGKTDKAYLSTFIKADILTCNGSAIDGFSMEYLASLASTRGVILLTDPDFPGAKIRNEISQKVPNCKHAFIDKQKSIKHHKVGVAECDQQEILRALNHVVTFTDKINNHPLAMRDLMEMHLIGPNSQLNKEKVCHYFHLGFCNAKTMLKRLNLLHITKNMLEEAIQ